MRSFGFENNECDVVIYGCCFSVLVGLWCYFLFVVFAFAVWFLVVFVGVVVFVVVVVVVVCVLLFVFST